MTGIMGYNRKTNRFGLLVMDLWEITGFHCGDTIEVWDYDTREWIPTRMEKTHDGIWYLVGTDLKGEALEGLKVRVK